MAIIIAPVTAKETSCPSSLALLATEAVDSKPMTRAGQHQAPINAGIEPTRVIREIIRPFWSPSSSPSTFLPLSTSFSTSFSTTFSGLICFSGSLFSLIRGLFSVGLTQVTQSSSSGSVWSALFTSTYFSVSLGTEDILVKDAEPC